MRLGTHSITNMSYMFNNCYSLASVPLFDTADVTNMSRMFQSCTSLASVPLFDTADVTDMSVMFANCYSLVSGALEGTKVSISYVNCSLSAAALDAIYTGLATATSTITITGNRGAAASTKTIATNKGWTVTN